MNKPKKYILKPGKHQFAPKSPATHSSDNLTDDEAEWYIDKYPHIKSLFIPCRQPLQSESSPEPEVSVTNPSIGVITNNNNEDLPATN
jgi:hypothetical protein